MFGISASAYYSSKYNEAKRKGMFSKNPRSITENGMRKLLKKHGMSEKEINVQIQLQKYMNSDPIVINDNVYVLKEGERNEQ